MRKLKILLATALLLSFSYSYAAYWLSGGWSFSKPGGFYAYASSTINEYPNAYIFYCGNKNANQIKDHIVLTKIRNPRFTGKNSTKWGHNIQVSDKAVLAPSPGKWDGRHLCDPSVIRGSFGLDGVSYSYALFYTGSADPMENGTENQIGVAFSHDLNTWKKYPHPLVRKNCSSCWGVGQPSVTSVDGQANVLLFMTRGTSTHTGMSAIQLDLSNLQSYSTNVPALKNEWSLPTNGLNLGVGGNSSSLNGADLMYNISLDRFYMVWGSKYNNLFPSWISQDVTVSYISGSSIWSGSGTWSYLKTLSNGNNTKVFDAGFERNPYGNNLVSNRISVGASTIYNGRPWPYNYMLSFKSLIH